MEQGLGRRRRRVHSAEFKAEAVAASRKPGVSIAAVAMEHSINANLLRRWVIEAERAEPAAVGVPKTLPPPRELRSGADAACADARGCDPCRSTPGITGRERAMAELGDARVPHLAA